MNCKLKRNNAKGWASAPQFILHPILKVKHRYHRIYSPHDLLLLILHPKYLQNLPFILYSLFSSRF